MDKQVISKKKPTALAAAKTVGKLFGGYLILTVTATYSYRVNYDFTKKVNQHY